jgi:tRNA U34 5-carboxymethylaminomethyl modifying GTPase MnmE/TrmE
MKAPGRTQPSLPPPPAAAALPFQVAQSAQDDVPYDCWTVDLRDAAIALGEVSGDEVAEEVLDSVFSRFCLGK